MEEQFDKLARLRANSTNPIERRKILDAMIPIGTYDELARLLPRITGQTLRARILDRMLPLGTYEQLTRLRANSTDPAERRKILDAMIPIGAYDELARLLSRITGQTLRARILDRMLNLAGAQAKNHINGTQGKKLIGSSKVTQLPKKESDIFVAHASEDKGFVTPLAVSLRQRGLKVWYDDFILKVGDSLRQEIDRGLAQSLYGIVVLSHNFFAKHWPKKELDGLAAKEQLHGKVILPVWHNIDKEEITSYSPTLAGIVAVKSSIGIEAVTNKILEAISH